MRGRREGGFEGRRAERREGNGREGEGRDGWMEGEREGRGGAEGRRWEGER